MSDRADSMSKKGKHFCPSVRLDPLGPSSTHQRRCINMNQPISKTTESKDPGSLFQSAFQAREDGRDQKAEARSRKAEERHIKFEQSAAAREERAEAREERAVKRAETREEREEARERRALAREEREEAREKREEDREILLNSNQNDNKGGDFSYFRTADGVRHHIDKMRFEGAAARDNKILDDLAVMQADIAHITEDFVTIKNDFVTIKEQSATIQEHVSQLKVGQARTSRIVSGMENRFLPKREELIGPFKNKKIME
ncbi:hypothetical protein H4Q26_009806 [Puccinia striiformis f. sp. tritici PST-130]|nr:hypothetical protein H4Q26_009806 [Puccinia striiformis f. sp. tritici PST-130]